MAASTEEKHRRIQQWQTRGDDTAVESLVRTLLHDHDPEVRGAVAVAMGKMASGGRPVKSLMIEALGRALGDDESPVRLKAVEALGRIGGEQAMHCLVQALQNRQYAERMLAAEKFGRSLAESAFAEDEERAQKDKARGDAWDLQWAAAQALAKIGSVHAVGPMIGWAERLLISDVRVMSAEEKSELIRAVLAGIFRKLESGEIFDLSSQLEQAVPVYSWEPINKAERKFGWLHAKRANPIWVLFQDEMNRRKAEYMKALSARDTASRGGAQAASANVGDTLFQPIAQAASANAGDTLFQPIAAPAGANARDTLFAPIAPQGSAANAKDTLFSPIGPAADEASEEAVFGGAAEAQAERRKAELLRALGKRDQLPLARHASSGSEPPKSAEPQASPEELERRRNEYMKTLGAQDSLFMPIEMKPPAIRGETPEAAAPPPAAPPRPAAPKPPATTPSIGPVKPVSAEEAERRRRASLAAVDDALRDTLFQPISKSASADDLEKRRREALAEDDEPKETLFQPIPAIERPTAPPPAAATEPQPAAKPAEAAKKKPAPARRRRGPLARFIRVIKFLFGRR